MPNITALIRSTIATTWFIVVVTLFGETYAPFKMFLASIAGHHWTTKSIFSLVFFALAYGVFHKSPEQEDVKSGAVTVLINTVLCGAALLIFFIWHFMKV